MNFDRALEKLMKDPEKRVKIYIAYNVGIVLVNVAIVIGLLVLVLRTAGVV